MKHNYSRVCIPCSMYCMTYYLLMSTKEEIDNTFFFFAHTIPESLRKSFPNSAYINLKGWVFKYKPVLALYMLIKRRIKWPFLFKADIYGLDFYWYLLRGLKNNYVEDGPFVLDIWETNSMYQFYLAGLKAHPLKKFIRRLLYGEYYLHPVGTSSSTKAIYTTVPFDKPYHHGLPNIVIDLKKAWRDSPEEKKEFILSVYDITKEDLRLMQQRNTIILTQPMYVDHVMSQDEQITIYKQMVEKYGAEHVIIKNHPRDLIDYKILFPNVICFNKAIPMQLLAILGVNFEKVLTVNSSAALSFGRDADIEWWAEKLDYPNITDSGVKTLAEAKHMFK